MGKLANKLVLTVSGILLASSLLLSGCGVDSEGFYSAALGLNKGAILITTANGTTSYTVTKYSLEGELLQVLADTTANGLIPRGMVQLDPFHVLLAVDGVDSLWSMNIMSGQLSPFYQGALFAGNIYHLARRGDSTFVIETSTIERFNGNQRYPASGAVPYIPATVGACTISNARGISFNSDGNLLVMSFTNSRVLLYDVSGATAVCLASDNSFGAVQPIPIIGHSNGNLYFGAQTNNSIYSGPDDLSASPTVLTNVNMNNPTAMAEMPDGSILVANDGTDTIVRIDPDTGNTINDAFIKNGFTALVTDIVVIPPQ